MELTAKEAALQSNYTFGHSTHSQDVGSSSLTTFDFRVLPPPDEVFPSQPESADSPQGVPRIGLALGSPRMLDHRDDLSPPQFRTEIFTKQQVVAPSISRKPSKWKKIGGLFKAKNALAVPVPHLGDSAAQVPRLQVNDGAPERLSTDEWPKFGPNSRLTGAGSSQNGLLLAVDIPAAQMERYSVMFDQVMRQNGQRPSLLTRRRKTLDNLRVPSNEAFLNTKRPPVPQRRATSPARSNFSLFPSTQPAKMIQGPDTQNLSRGPSALPRSNTLPVDTCSDVDERTLDERTPRPTPDDFVDGPWDISRVRRIFGSPQSTPRGSLDKALPNIKSKLPAQTTRLQGGSSLSVAHNMQDSAGRSRCDSIQSDTGEAKVLPPTLPFADPARPSSSDDQAKNRLALPGAKSRRRSYSLGPPRTSATPPGTVTPPQGNPAHRSQSSDKAASSQTSTPPHQRRKGSLQTTMMQQVCSSDQSSSPKQSMLHKTSASPPTQLPKPITEPVTKAGRPQLQIATNTRMRPTLQIPNNSLSDSSATRSLSQLRPNTNSSSLSTQSHQAHSPTINIRAPSPHSAGSSGILSPRMPLATDPDEIDEEETEQSSKLPVVEVSIARSVSVSRAKRQILVPVGARVDTLLPKERVVERGPMMPRIMDTSIRSKHAVSQHLQVESFL
ncbi:Uncharacterized protein PECH_000742 [Penicillium ucsense]|uniref:Uncharacterized protein n=1 Tax=Penicillium ucsense TaxID=2839758 RepID=A0A8J8VYF2_9EURO|nr:Uncharacterized protein PECM_000386 [Penicillium ucsense]KAF7733411.1 Uncharacterized protein PECH_000742 [Penicillium ucsense]